MSKGYIYQQGYSEIKRSDMYNKEMRQQKAKKVTAVLKDFCNKDLSLLSCLDLGCSTGWGAIFFGNIFSKVTAIDIDKDAVAFGAANTQSNNVRFIVGDSMSIMAKDSSFDVVICSHVYEHVPDNKKLMEEIYRVLKSGGICYFAGPNKLWPVEPHYNLLGLSLLPKKLADIYVKVFRKKDYYYENLLTYWQLRKLVSRFEIIDYTPRILTEPEKFMATDMFKADSIKAIFANILSKLALWLSPTFVWVLRKTRNK